MKEHKVVEAEVPPPPFTTIPMAVRKQSSGAELYMTS